MSRVCYLASDVPLKEKTNPFVRKYSINEAVRAGINLDLELLEDIDKDKPDTILWAEREEHMEFPTISKAKPYSEAPKSDKKYYANIDGAPEKDLKGIIEYIRNHMRKTKDVNAKSLELWCVWLGADETDLEEKRCRLTDLSEEYLYEIFTDDDKDYKLVITR